MDYKRLIIDRITLDGLDKQSVYDLITQPKDASMGDLCIPCFKLAKEMKKSPMAIADAIADSVSKGGMIKDVQSVAGFVNFTFDNALYAREVLDGVLKAGANYGKSDEGKGKTVCIDYSSVNIAKPFHMGHLLNTALGGAIYRIYKTLGYDVVGINHLGDWGTQFGKLIVAYKLWGDRNDIEKRGVRALVDIYVKFHKEEEKNPSLGDEARKWFKAIEDSNKEALELFEYFKAITLKEVDRIYKRLNITFDSYAGESFYNDKMQPVLDELTAKGLLVESDGARVVKFDGDTMPPCLLQRSDGATLYATRDMAAAFYRKKTYDFYKCLYVVAYQQNLHFQQVFKVLEMMGCEWAKDMIHVAHGMVSLESGAMSTREGNVVFLEDVLNTAVAKAKAVIDEKNPDLEGKQEIAEQVGVGAVLFGVLYNSRIKDMTFSFDKVLNFEGETGPYVQYTFARCNSLLEKSGGIGEEIDFSGLDNDSCKAILLLLDKYPELLKESARKYEPSVVTRFAVDLSQAFNKFYFEYKINSEKAGIKNARLLLTKSVKQALSNALGLLGIATPAKM
ncbi:MAG: arginine--tRNA ligase [Clostridia bacterium]|nr:arginine--tRNA ligase [Clostridia bacterium]MDE7328554.1 arginine--tRNA ligase [Clostridia bacterium]